MGKTIKLNDVGNAGSGFDGSMGGGTMGQAMAQLSKDNAFGRGQNLNAYLGTIATGILASMIAPKAGMLRKLTVNAAVAGSAGTTVVQVQKNGVLMAGGTVTVDNADPDNVAKSSADLAVAFAAGDLIQLVVTTAPTGGTGLTATALLEADDNVLSIS